MGVVEEDKCLGCGLCVGVCTQDAMTMMGREDPYRETSPGVVGNIVMYAVFLTVILPIALTFKALRR